jgi:hypothetical protein
MPAPEWAWPEIVDKLLSGPAGIAVRHLADQLKHQGISRDLRCVAFSGTGRNAGRTSLVLALTKVLVTELATRVTVIDADFVRPEIARVLSVQPATDPEESPLALRQLIPGKLGFVPLAGPLQLESLNATMISAIHSVWQALKAQCDLVVIDAGPWESPITPALIDARGIDACVGVCPFREPALEWPGPEQRNRTDVEWLGVVETFVPPAQLAAKRT